MLIYHVVSEVSHKTAHQVRQHNQCVQSQGKQHKGSGNRWPNRKRVLQLAPELFCQWQCNEDGNGRSTILTDQRSSSIISGRLGRERGQCVRKERLPIAASPPAA